MEKSTDSPWQRVDLACGLNLRRREKIEPRVAVKNEDIFAFKGKNKTKKKTKKCRGFG